MQDGFRTFLFQEAVYHTSLALLLVFLDFTSGFWQNRKKTILSFVSWKLKRPEFLLLVLQRKSWLNSRAYALLFRQFPCAKHNARTLSASYRKFLGSNQGLRPHWRICHACRASHHKRKTFLPPSLSLSLSLQTLDSVKISIRGLQFRIAVGKPRKKAATLVWPVRQIAVLSFIQECLWFLLVLGSWQQVKTHLADLWTSVPCCGDKYLGQELKNRLDVFWAL